MVYARGGRKSNAMKTAIDRILAAEEEAKRRLVNARQRAETIVTEAEAQGEVLRNTARDRALKESELLLQRAVAEADSAGRKIVDTATANAEQTLLQAKRLNLDFLACNINTIAGILK